MIPDTLFKITKSEILLNGEKIPNFADFQQQMIELKNNPMFELLIADAKTRAYKDGFLETKDWDTTLGSKGFFACAANMELLVNTIASFKGE